MSALLWHERGAARLPAVIALSLIPSLPRPHLERLVQQLIDRMDDTDGDTDVEANGDEMDGGNAEDDFGVPANWLLGPGCPISDPDGGDDEDREDEGQSEQAWQPPHWPVLS